MRVGSFGVIFIVFLVCFIMYVGIDAFSNTYYSFGSKEDFEATDWHSHERILLLFNLNFAPLAGDLCTGYFLHTCALPVLRASAQPEKSSRDLFLGYLLVFFSYTAVGVFGYIGFMGYNFKEYFLGVQDD